MSKQKHTVKSRWLLFVVLKLRKWSEALEKSYDKEWVFIDIMARAKQEKKEPGGPPIFKDDRRG